jgi:hypothetical protein
LPRRADPDAVLRRGVVDAEVIVAGLERGGDDSSGRCVANRDGDYLAVRASPFAAPSVTLS